MGGFDGQEMGLNPYRLFQINRRLTAEIAS